MVRAAVLIPVYYDGLVETVQFHLTLPHLKRRKVIESPQMLSSLLRPLSPLRIRGRRVKDSTLLQKTRRLELLDRNNLSYCLMRRCQILESLWRRSALF